VRVGVVSTSFPRHEGDGAGRFVLEHARALARAGHSTEVLAPEPGTGALPASVGGCSVSWVPYLRPRALERTFYGAGSPENLARDPLAWLGVLPFVRALDAAVEERVHRWDAIVSHWALPCALVAGRHARGRPHLAVFHSADVTALRYAPSRVLATIAKRATALQFVCGAHRDAFCARVPWLDARVRVLPMGIASTPSKTPRDGRVRRLLAVGRLVPIKRMDRLIEAIDGLDGVELVIAGDGPERARLERRARGARVELTGAVPYRELGELFDRADAFVVASGRSRLGREEGVPHSMLEAMLRSLPIVATNTGGIGEVVRDGVDGLLVPPDDAGALRRAIAALRDDAELARSMGDRARARATGYTWDVQAPALHALLFGTAAPGIDSTTDARRSPLPAG
jgi:glycosyltransferase involved in cell wall biosynthesis